MFSSRQSIMPLARPPTSTQNQEAEAEGHVKSAMRISASLNRTKRAAYGAASCLRSEALQIERLTNVLECEEFAVLVREDATQRHQDHLKATIEPQILQLLEMAEERAKEREKTREKIRRRATTLDQTGTPRADTQAVRREELLLQHKERLTKEIEKLRKGNDGRDA